MGGDFAGTSFSPSAVHALIEVQANPGISARELSETLRLEKSSVSRALRKLIIAGILEEKTSDTDSRSKRLFLTDTGNAQVNDIHTFARAQVSRALTQLRPGEGDAVLKGLQLYARALHHLQEDEPLPIPVRIVTGYRPGMIARIVEMRALEQAKVSGFDHRYEAQIANELADLFSQSGAGSQHLWAAMYDDRMLGSVVLDAAGNGDGIAHLRWFIVDESVRAGGIGRRLLNQALEHADATGVLETHLCVGNLNAPLNHLLAETGFKAAKRPDGHLFIRASGTKDDKTDI
nr:helix-turn-helix domain-containing GNAT family N-acetyltransferase [Erwinia sp. S43]